MSWLLSVDRNLATGIFNLKHLIMENKLLTYCERCQIEIDIDYTIVNNDTLISKKWTKIIIFLLTSVFVDLTDCYDF